MRPKKTSSTASPGDLFRARLDQILDREHPLFRLGRQIDWVAFEREFGVLYVEKVGRPGLRIRLMVGLHYLKHAFDESDESVVERLLENPYWQDRRGRKSSVFRWGRNGPPALYGRPRTGYPPRDVDANRGGLIMKVGLY